MQDFQTLLSGSAAAHGHLCPGQAVGVRMAMLGCALIGLDDPASPSQIKKLIVFVEIDRCAADAIAHVTGVKLGRRSLKFVDHGIMAATFVNLESGRAFRIVCRESARELAEQYAPGIADKTARQLRAYAVMPADELFRIEEVAVDLPESELPGPSRFKAVCARCGETVRDRKEVRRRGRVLCRPCARGAYFRTIAKRPPEAP